MRRTRAKSRDITWEQVGSFPVCPSACLTRCCCVPHVPRLCLHESGLRACSPEMLAAEARRARGISMLLSPGIATHVSRFRCKRLMNSKSC